ncbi:unnamed protein product, partial [Prorocentrum cordatum]
EGVRRRRRRSRRRRRRRRRKERGNSTTLTFLPHIPSRTWEAAAGGTLPRAPSPARRKPGAHLKPVVWLAGRRARRQGVPRLVPGGGREARALPPTPSARTPSGRPRDRAHPECCARFRPACPAHRIRAPLSLRRRDQATEAAPGKARALRPRAAARALCEARGASEQPSPSPSLCAWLEEPRDLWSPTATRSAAVGEGGGARRAASRE